MKRRPLRPLTREEMDSLWKEHKGLAYASAPRIADAIGTDVDDVIQELFLSMCRSWQTYQSERSKFSTYAYRGFKITKLRILRKSRRERLDRTRNLTGLESDAIMDDERDPLEVITTQEAYEIALNCLHNKPNLRAIVIDRLGNGMSVEEVAAKHGVSRQRVNERMKYAMIRVRSHLRARGLM